MEERYRPKTVTQKLAWLVEEAGEVQAAVGKSLRWGLDSYNPELKPEDRELNGDWVLRELRDLECALHTAREALQVEMQAIDGVDREVGR